MLYSMDLTVLHLAIPALSRELAPTATELLWIIDVYGFLVAGSLITMGTLGDRIGRRRLLFVGAAAFGAASVLAAFSTSAAMLIATRALLSVGISAVVVAALAAFVALSLREVPASGQPPAEPARPAEALVAAELAA